MRKKFVRKYARPARLQRFSVRFLKTQFWRHFFEKSAFLEGTIIFKNLRYDAKYLIYDRNTPFLAKKNFLKKILKKNFEKKILKKKF